MSTDVLGSLSAFGRLAPTRGLGSISIARAACTKCVRGAAPPDSGIWGGGAAVWALDRGQGSGDPKLLLGKRTPGCPRALRSSIHA